jgi:hypothetical protein
MELELIDTQTKVGPYRADLLCRDTNTDSYVAIENQLERADHLHLGQLMTYAAGLDTVNIIWVAQKFNEEHRAALDWLNRITYEKYPSCRKKPTLLLEVRSVSRIPCTHLDDSKNTPHSWSEMVVFKNRLESKRNC